MLNLAFQEQRVSLCATKSPLLLTRWKISSKNLIVLLSSDSLWQVQMTLSSMVLWYVIHCVLWTKCRSHTCRIHHFVVVHLFVIRFLVRVSYLEIYNEEVRDLLSKDQQHRLEVRWNPGHRSKLPSEQSNQHCRWTSHSNQVWLLHTSVWGDCLTQQWSQIPSHSSVEWLLHTAVLSESFTLQRGVIYSFNSIVRFLHTSMRGDFFTQVLSDSFTQ